MRCLGPRATGKQHSCNSSAARPWAGVKAEKKKRRKCGKTEHLVVRCCVGTATPDHSSLIWPPLLLSPHTHSLLSCYNSDDVVVKLHGRVLLPTMLLPCTGPHPAQHTQCAACRWSRAGVAQRANTCLQAEGMMLSHRSHIRLQDGTQTSTTNRCRASQHCNSCGQPQTATPCKHV